MFLGVRQQYSQINPNPRVDSTLISWGHCIHFYSGYLVFRVYIFYIKKMLGDWVTTFAFNFLFLFICQNIDNFNFFYIFVRNIDNFNFLVEAICIPGSRIEVITGRDLAARPGPARPGFGPARPGPKKQLNFQARNGPKK